MERGVGGEGASAAGGAGAGWGAGQPGRLGEEGQVEGHLVATLRRGGKRKKAVKGFRAGLPAMCHLGL